MKFTLLEKIFSIKNDRWHKVIHILGIKFAISRKNKEDFMRFYRPIDNAEFEFVHILHASSFAVELVKFLNTFVDHRKHLFIFKSGPTLYTSSLKADNVIEGNLLSLKINLNITKKIIVHSLLFENDIEYFYNNPQLLKITYWSIWGGDLYCNNNHKSNFVKANVKAILTVFDKIEYNKQYGEKSCFNIIYPSSTLNDLPCKLNNEKNSPINILINHCADESTLVLLKKLEKYKNENIRIYTALSYTTHMQSLKLKKEIINLGKTIFKDNFVPILDWMDTNEYNKFLSKFDIFILGMKRQQGIGNLRICAVQGAKLFMNSKNQTYKELENINLNIYDLNKIDDMNFEEFKRYTDEERLNNRNIFIERNKYETVMNSWKKVFED